MNLRLLKRLATAFVMALAAGGAATVPGKARIPLGAHDGLGTRAARMTHRHFDGDVSSFPWRPLETQRLDLVLCRRHPKNFHGRDGCANAAAEAKHRCGLAALLEDDWATAVESLREATDLGPQNAVYWSDLAVALLADGRANRDPRQFVEALAASDHALRLRGDFGPALFNRACSLELLGLTSSALTAYSRCLLDPTDRWAQEAVSRLRRLRMPRPPSFSTASLASLTEGDLAETISQFPLEVRTFVEDALLPQWARHELACEAAPADRDLALARQIARLAHLLDGDNHLMETVASIDHASSSGRLLLAEAHLLFGEAREAYRGARRQEATRKFVQASNRFETGGSLSMWVEAGLLHNNCLDNPRTIVVQGYFSGGGLDESLLHDIDGLATFEHAAGMPPPLMTAGDDWWYSCFGHRTEAWRRRTSLFRKASATRDLRTLWTAIDAAGHAEALEGRWDTAHSLFTAMTDVLGQDHPAESARAYAWRALSAERLALTTEMTDDFSAARLAMTKIANRHLASEAAAMLLFAEAATACDRDPRAAFKSLTSLIDDRGLRLSLLSPEVRRERARARRAIGDTQGAIADLSATLAELTPYRHMALNRMDAYFGLADTITEELIDMYDHTGRVAESLRLARSEYEGDPEPATEHPPEGMMIARYIPLHDHMIVFITTSHGTSAIHVPVSYSEIDRSVRQLSRSIESDDQAWRVAASRLAKWLIDPLPLSGTRILAVVANRVIAQVPFSLLPRSATGHPLVEEVAVQTIWRPWARELFSTRRGSGVAAIGNPAVGFPQLLSVARLPAATAEARDAMNAYGDGILLTEAAATPERVSSALAKCRIADIAVHAIVDADDPSRSYLLLAPDSTSSGLLYLPDIEKMNLSNLDFVVMTGCRTAATTTSGDGTNSLARAFIAAGARNVIGSLWPLEDDVGREVASRLHRELLLGASPVDALQRVQQSMLHSRRPEFRSAFAWSGLRLYSLFGRPPKTKRLARMLLVRGVDELEEALAGREFAGGRAAADIFTVPPSLLLGRDRNSHSFLYFAGHVSGSGSRTLTSDKLRAGRITLHFEPTRTTPMPNVDARSSSCLSSLSCFE